jgi:Cdc6-like AAA superfamily ATPase
MHSSDRKKSNSILTRSVRKKKKISDSITVEKEISNVDCEASISNSMDIDENLFAEESLNFDSKNKYFLKERIIKKKQTINDIEEEKQNDYDEILEDSLPCRDNELKIIDDYIRKGLETKGSYSSLYISGMPGTGKTACVQSTLLKLKFEAENLKIPPFEYFYINAMKMSKNNNFYKILHDLIFTDDNKSSKSFQKCCSILDNFFKNRNSFNYNLILNNFENPHIVLIIDEIDCLIDKKQNILYNIFNWTTYLESKLIVISISNTLDLPERLMPKIVSRIGNNRLSFKPYLKDELIKILEIRLERFNFFSIEALKYCCMKVASVSGDLRRILQICKRAEEIFKSEKNRPLNIMINHVNQACNDLFDSKVMFVFKNIKIYEKVVIIAILYELKKHQSSKIPVKEIYKHQNNLNSQIGRVPLNFEEMRYIIYNLVKLKLIQLSEINNDNFFSNCITIKFYPEEFADSIKSENDDLVKKLIENYLN